MMMVVEEKSWGFRTPPPKSKNFQTQIVFFFFGFEIERERCFLVGK